MSVRKRKGGVAASVVVIHACVLAACAGGSAEKKRVETPVSAVVSAPVEAMRDFEGGDDPHCDATEPGREFAEFDTSGDDVADVRKVFLHVGDAAISKRLVMICRQADVNHDRRKDVTRIYDDDGRSLREFADRNFDGKVDEITHFQNEDIVLRELDGDFDGRLDAKIYYTSGLPTRAERDLRGRSTENQWRPDRWEYFENGKLVRMGTDVDGDMRVDHWDRDLLWTKAQDKAKAQAEASSSAD
jgi:hypothetical protein